MFLGLLRNLLVLVWWKDNWAEHPPAYVTLGVTQWGASLLPAISLLFGINALERSGSRAVCVVSAKPTAFHVGAAGCTSHVTSFLPLGGHPAWGTAFSSTLPTAADAVFIPSVCRTGKNHTSPFLYYLSYFKRKNCSRQEHTEAFRGKEPDPALWWRWGHYWSKEHFRRLLCNSITGNTLILFSLCSIKET